MNSPKEVKSDVPEIVNIFCSTCGTRHDPLNITRNQSYVTVGEQTPQHTCDTEVSFVKKVCMKTIAFLKIL